MKKYIANPVFTVEDAEELQILKTYCSANGYDYTCSDDPGESEQWVEVYQSFTPGELGEIIEFVQWVKDRRSKERAERLAAPADI